MATLLHVVCPHCDAVNRLPEARLADGGRCGKCRRPLFDGHPVAVDSGRFDLHVERSGIPVLVDFWAGWCGPCRMMAPEFEKAAARLEPGVRLLKLDTEAAPDVAARLGIRSIPTLILFQNGGEVARRAGATSAAGILSFVSASAASGDHPWTRRSGAS